MTGKEQFQVKVIYSSRKHPKFLKDYKEGIDYLTSKDLAPEIIDITKTPEAAEKYKVMATPLVIVKRGEETTRYAGIIESLRNIVTESDIKGNAAIQTMSIKRGLRIGEQITPEGKKNKESIENVIKLVSYLLGLAKFRITEFDKENKVATIEIKTEEDRQYTHKQKISELKALLEGLFEQIYDKEITAEETTCNYKSGKSCTFKLV